MSEKEILCNCIENYIELANTNGNIIDDYYSIISFIKTLQNQYNEYSNDFEKYLKIFKENGILDSYNLQNNNIAQKYFLKYGINLQKSYELLTGFAEGCKSRYINFLIVIGLCGKPLSKESRKILAMAYSWNMYLFANQSIYYTELYLKDNPHDSNFLSMNADNYFKLKRYEESIYYLKLALKYSKDSYPYKKIINIYKRQKDLNGAIKFLKNEKKSFKNLFNRERKNNINEYLKVLEKEQTGIVKHDFNGYDSIESLWNTDGSYNIKKSKYIELKNKYKEVFEAHIKRLDAISIITANGINNENIYSLIDLVKKDIKEFYKIESFYKDLNSIGMNNIYYYSDNYIKGYLMPKKICMLLEKENFIDEALLICDYCIENNILEDGTKNGMKGRRLRLKRKK